METENTNVDEQTVENKEVEDKKEPEQKTENTDTDKSKAENKEVETKKDTKEENATDLKLEDAQNTIKDLTKQLNTVNEQIVELDTVKKELDTAKKDIEKANSTVKEYEDLLNKMIEEKMKKIPEEYAELVPSNMTIPQQLEWLAKAESKGLFNKQKDVSGVEIGKPMGANVDMKADLDKISSGSKIAMAYNKIVKK